MVRKLLGPVALAAAIMGSSHSAQALGKFVLSVQGTTNFWDFSVGKGEFCWVDYAGSPYYYSGSTGCATGAPESGTIDRASDFSRGFTFPNGHAQRIAVGEQTGTVGQPLIVVTTAEGYLWFYETATAGVAPSWVRGPQLPSTLPTGIGAYGVTRLVYEAVNYYTGVAAANPIWILGKDNHVYHLVGSGIGTSWQDATLAYGIGDIAQLSYSGMYAAVMINWGDGTTAYYDDNADLWYYTAWSASAPMAVDSSFSTYFGANYYGAGGMFESWCGSYLGDGTCSYAFQLGYGGYWYDLDTTPTISGYPPVYSDDINDIAWGQDANAHSPDEEIPINVVEGSYMQISGQYGGGPRDPVYSDLIWVETNALRVYVYEIWLFEH